MSCELNKKQRQDYEKTVQKMAETPSFVHLARLQARDI